MKSATDIRRLFNLFVMGLGLAIFASSQGWAEEKKHISFASPAENTQYTQQYSIAVSPTHQIRIFEIHRTYPHNPPAFEGIRLVEEWMRAFSDYVDGNGRVSGYGQYVMENGDRVYYWADGVTQTTNDAKADTKSEATLIKRITGGSGKFTDLRGALRYQSRFDSQAGINEGHTEGEYWLEK